MPLINVKFIAAIRRDIKKVIIQVVTKKNNAKKMFCSTKGLKD